MGAVAAGVENYIDNQKHTPTWRIQLCLIADALLYVCFESFKIYAESIIFLIILDLQVFSPQWCCLLLRLVQGRALRHRMTGIF
jgi:hypothetical protein